MENQNKISAEESALLKDYKYWQNKLSIVATELAQLKKQKRFEIPTDKQLIEIALLFNDGKLDAKQLSEMVGMVQFILDRLYENGNIKTKSSKE